MANFTAQDVKKLRDLTGAGMLDSKKALDEADGDFDKAVEFLRIKGAKDVGKRAGRTAANGIVAHSGHALLELNCETDFVPRPPTSSRSASSSSSTAPGTTSPTRPPWRPPRSTTAARWPTWCRSSPPRSARRS